MDMHEANADVEHTLHGLYEAPGIGWHPVARTALLAVLLICSAWLKTSLPLWVPMTVGLGLVVLEVLHWRILRSRLTAESTSELALRQVVLTALPGALGALQGAAKTGRSAADAAQTVRSHFEISAQISERLGSEVDMAASEIMRDMADTMPPSP